jgi:hypothetical protein
MQFSVDQTLDSSRDYSNTLHFNNNGNRTQATESSLTMIPNEVLALIFKRLDTPRDLQSISLTCWRFRLLIERDIDDFFIKGLIHQEIKTKSLHINSLGCIGSLINRFHELSEKINSLRANRFIDRLSYYLEENLSLNTLFLLIQPLILQWDAYLTSQEGINPEPFLTAIYNSQFCPKALQLFFAYPTTILASLESYSNSKSEKICSLLKHCFHLKQSIEEYPSQPLLATECKMLFIHPHNQFLEKEIVAICYQQSAISLPQILYGHIQKIKKNGLYDVQFHCTKENKKRTYTLAPKQIGKITFHSLSCLKSIRIE